MRRLVLIAAAAAALGAVAAGCGGSGTSSGSGEAPLSKSEYQARMSELGSELTKTFGSLGATDPADPSSAAGIFDKLADGLDAAAERFASVTAPENVAEAHQQLVDGSRQAADELHELADDVRNTKLADLVAELPKLRNPTNLPGFTQIQEALAEITSKGYTFSSDGATVTVQSG